MTYSTIGDHVELQRGTTYKSALLDQPGPVLLGLGSIERDGGFRSDKLRTYGGPSAEKLLVRPGDLYVSLKDVTQAGDLLGAIARVPKSVSVGRMTQDTVKLIFKSDIPKEYFYWLLRTPQYRQYCRSHATGTTNLGLSRDDFFSFKIPDLDAEKRLLTDSLENLEAKIRTNHQINQTLEQMAQAIFKSWFVDFEPVKAKIAALEAGGSEEDALLAAMQAISGKGEAELTRLQAEHPEQYAELRATAELFPSAMQDSELGEIPEGWRVNQIGDLVTRIPVGKKYSQKTASETGDVPVLDQGKSGIIGYHNEKPGVTACPDDPVIVFANHTCYMRLIMHEFSAIQNVLPFKSKPAKALNIFWLYFATHGKQEFIEYKGHWPDFVIKEIVVPDDSIASRFGSIAKDLVVNQFRNEKQNETLSAIRDAMLPKLLSGELSVTDVANQTEGAEGSVNV
ncbi:hypothetical protein MLC59_12420 [Marinobacter bryozoorum]|uniref:restriction endonuclease subunit S n=1 Tax=Marinobacter bryozoorum TaxID=256324 RepID=UPI0020038480|nr:restriction endonuclease subunit S [Marinobacter bryozoorum]MCK7544966.1 hypothetical protein [Marinobacter bryozoorum]